MEPILKRCLSQLQNRWGSLFNQQVLNIVAYGSGAVPQTSNLNQIGSNTLDLLIEVRNSSYFHQQLMRSNQSDYSGMGYVMGAGWVNFATENVFPMHSNHIKIDGKKVKYSIIGKKYFREDMLTWKYLSFAGRMHKAVIPLQPYQENFEADLQRNRQAALAVALISKKRSQDAPFSDILQNLVEISYAGDIRFSAKAENPMKIKNIVNYSYPQLAAIYYPILQKFSQKIKDIKLGPEQRVTYMTTPPMLAGLMPLVPSTILEKLIKVYVGKTEEGEKINLIEKILIGGAMYLSSEMVHIIVRKNRWNSFKMATENFLTASPLDNLSYILAKVNKRQ